MDREREFVVVRHAYAKPIIAVMGTEDARRRRNAVSILTSCGVQLHAGAGHDARHRDGRIVSGPQGPADAPASLAIADW
jgi:hypothetical protein